MTAQIHKHSAQRGVPGHDDVPPYAGSGLLELRPDLQCAEVTSVLFESRLLEREEHPLAVIEVSVALTDNVGEVDEATTRHLW